MQSSSSSVRPEPERVARPRFWQTYSDQLVGVASILVILLAWELASRAGLLNAYHFPPPSKLAATLWQLIDVGFPRDITAMVHIRATFWRIIQGYVLATVLAIPLGLIIGRSTILDRASSPIITFARSVATISLLPLAVAWFGVGELTRVLLIAYASFWIILTNVIQAVKGVDMRWIQAAQTLGASDRQIFFRVIMPGSLPRIFGGMKVALGVAFLVIVAVEMIGTVRGLGALIMEARTFYRSDAAMVGMIFIAIVGFFLAKGLDRLERWLLPWAVGLEEVER
jgi:ABC-type nitrate/sulfonate/bicarbonate transport system permease component